jgi:hypothetical protein
LFEFLASRHDVDPQSIFFPLSERSTDSYTRINGKICLLFFNIEAGREIILY